jgi:hypothetical protein
MKMASQRPGIFPIIQGPVSTSGGALNSLATRKFRQVNQSHGESGLSRQTGNVIEVITHVYLEAIENSCFYSFVIIK